MKRVLLTAVLSFFTGIFAHAASIGDPAPALTVERWVKGAPTRVGPGANVFVVEFWATWCGPCESTIPYLTQLQNKYKANGVIFLGISDEDLATVSPFVAAKGAAMDYRVGIDPSKRTFRSWMTAFGESGIPCAFIVGTNGLVLWHGYPNENLDRALQQILAGTFDILQAKQLEAGDRAVEVYTAMVSKPRPDPQAAALGERILAEYSQDWRVPHRLARAILTGTTVRYRDFGLALRATTKATEMTKQRSSDALAMHARALYANGKRAESVQTQKQAISLGRDAVDQAELQKQLALYEKGLAAVPAKK